VVVDVVVAVVLTTVMIMVQVLVEQKNLNLMVDVVVTSF
jgi:hypothetical protein